MSDPSHERPDPPPDTPLARSSEEALRLHARALDGLRATQARLAEELAQGHALREGLGRLDAGLDDLARGQERLARELADTRRGLVFGQWSLVVVGGLLLGLGGWWFVARGADGGAPAGLPADGAAASTAPAPDALLAELRRAEQRAEEAEALARAAALAELRAEDEIAAASSALRSQQDEIAKLRDERNGFVGEAARLRAELVRAEQRYAALTAGGLAAPEPTPGAEPRTSRTSEREASPELMALNAALSDAGLPGVRVLELGAVVAGGARDVLLSGRDPDTGAARAELWERAELVEHAGGLALRTTGLAGDPEAERLLPLPAGRAADFVDTPLAPPARLLRVGRAREALKRLLAGQSLEVLALHDVVDGELRDLELRALGTPGEAAGVFRAARAELLRDGPTLLLRDGSVVRDGSERPFWRGELRRPLPGADAAAWFAALEALEALDDLAPPAETDARRAPAGAPPAEQRP